MKPEGRNVAGSPSHLCYITENWSGVLAKNVSQKAPVQIFLYLAVSFRLSLEITAKIGADLGKCFCWNEDFYPPTADPNIS